MAWTLHEYRTVPVHTERNCLRLTRPLWFPDPRPARGSLPSPALLRPCLSTSAITLVESSVIAMAQATECQSNRTQSFCQSNRTHARARNRIGRSRTLPSVIDRRRAPTGKKRPSRGRYVAVLSPRPIFEQRARPFLLTPPPEFASVGPSSVAEQCSSR